MVAEAKVRMDALEATVREQKAAIDRLETRLAAAGPTAGATPPTERAELELPKEPVSLAAAATKGRSDAPLALVEFTDFQCPFCQVFVDRVWPAFEKDYVETGKVLFAIRHFPLAEIHPAAVASAVAAECARNQGRFWSIHDWLFANRSALTKDGAVAVPRGVLASGMDEAAYKACASGLGPAKVASELATGRALGVTGTPAFFLGRLETGDRVRVTRTFRGTPSPATLKQAIETALGHLSGAK